MTTERITFKAFNRTVSVISHGNVRRRRAHRCCDCGELATFVGETNVGDRFMYCNAHAFSIAEFAAIVRADVKLYALVSE